VGLACRHKLFVSYIRMQSKHSDQDVIYGYVSSSANDSSELPDNVLRPTISSSANKLRKQNSILSVRRAQHGCHRHKVKERILIVKRKDNSSTFPA
jgi:hypothetical protein